MTSKKISGKSWTQIGNPDRPGTNVIKLFYSVTDIAENFNILISNLRDLMSLHQKIRLPSYSCKFVSKKTN